MAQLYNLEPQPTAKCILRTTSGDLTLELFAKQTPLASRNFLQHCLDGYYINTTFHRLVPNFILQGGDPTNTGRGGVSALSEDGEPFQDEFHSRLKFNRRGLLGMANEGKDGNGSQFFLTLAATPELQERNTMFGRVEGDTIYNLMKMADAEMEEGEGSERPLYPDKILGAEVLVNPFEDMVARVREAPRMKEEKKEVAKKRKKPAGRNVLSFAGGEEGEEEGLVMPVIKKAKANPRMVVAEDEDGPEDGRSEAAKEKKTTKARKQKSSSPPPNPETSDDDEEQQPAPKPTKPKRSPTPDSEPEQAPKSKPQTVLEKTNAEIAALKASMKRTVDAAPAAKEKPKSALEAMIPVTSSRGRKRGKATDEKGAFDVFNAFKQRLQDLPASTSETPAEPTANGASVQNGEANADAADDDEAALCDLHFIANCQSCKNWAKDEEVEDEDEDDGKWMSHALTFQKDTLGKDLEWKRRMNEIEVIDPREKAKAIRAEEKERRDKKGKGKR